MNRIIHRLIRLICLIDQGEEDAKQLSSVARNRPQIWGQFGDNQPGFGDIYGDNPVFTQFAYMRLNRCNIRIYVACISKNFP